MPRPVTPLLTVDVVLFDAQDRVLLIRRGRPPFEGAYALPGGFVDVGERVEDAAIREAAEETGLDVRLITLLGIYSDPARDARFHTAGVVYVAEATGTPVAADDARHLDVFDPDGPLPLLAFDHAQILADYRQWRAHGTGAPLRPAH